MHGSSRVAREQTEAADQLSPPEGARTRPDPPRDAGAAAARLHWTHRLCTRTASDKPTPDRPVPPPVAAAVHQGIQEMSRRAPSLDVVLSTLCRSPSNVDSSPWIPLSCSVLLWPFDSTRRPSSWSLHSVGCTCDHWPSGTCGHWPSADECVKGQQVGLRVCALRRWVSMLGRDDDQLPLPTRRRDPDHLPRTGSPAPLWTAPSLF